VIVFNKKKGDDFMNRQERVRRITYSLVIAFCGILLLVLQKIPFLRIGLAVILVFMGLLQLKEKDSKTALTLIASGVAAYFLFPLIQGSLYILGILILILGLVLAFMAWKKNGA
jgi:predicted branched-subunit amino acid permease